MRPGFRVKCRRRRLRHPALALLLVALFNATPADVVWVLAVYNASGFVACAVLTVLALAVIELTGWRVRRVQRGGTAAVAAGDPAGNDAVPTRR